MSNKTQILSDENVLFIYQQVKKPNMFTLGAFSCRSDKVGAKVIAESGDILEVIRLAKEAIPTYDIAYAITNSILAKRLLIEEGLGAKVFEMFLNSTKDETERIIRYSSYLNLITGIELKIEPLTLGMNIILLDGSTSMGYMVDYAQIKTYTIALMDYLSYQFGKANIDRISRI